MLFDKKILVVLSQGEAAEKAFKRGVLIAERLGCRLDLFWQFNPLPDHPMMRLKAQLESEGMAIRDHFADPGRLDKTITEHWHKEHFALLVKSCDADHKGLMAPQDWQLLRHAPCPVLLVKKDSLWERGQVLAAVDPFSRKPGCAGINRQVLRLAEFISQQALATLQLVVAYAPPMLGAEPENQSINLLEEKARQAAERLLAEQGLTCDDYLIGEGPAEYWIPHVAKQQQAALVVIGTHARQGLKGMLLGNTAERILDRLSCDVLVLREGLSETFEQLLD